MTPGETVSPDDGQPFTYAPVGAGRDALFHGTGLPDGHHRVQVWTRLRGTDLDRRAEALLAGRVHRGGGIDWRETRTPVAVGTPVRARLGPVPMPTRVVWVSRGPDHAGFGYGTVPGHPFRGEGGYLLRRDASGVVRFGVVMYTVPDLWWARAFGPLPRCGQRLSVRLLTRAIDRAGGPPRSGPR